MISGGDSLVLSKRYCEVEILDRNLFKYSVNIADFYTTLRRENIRYGKDEIVQKKDNALCAQYHTE